MEQFLANTDAQALLRAEIRYFDNTAQIFDRIGQRIAHNRFGNVLFRDAGAMGEPCLPLQGGA